MDDDTFKEVVAACVVGFFLYSLVAIAPKAMINVIDFFVPKDKAKKETKTAKPRKLHSGNLYSEQDTPEDNLFFYVWICTGASSHAYHSDPECRWLQLCSGEIEKVATDVARDMGRKPCKMCFK